MPRRDWRFPGSVYMGKVKEPILTYGKRAQSTAGTPIKPPCCFITAYRIIFTVGHGLHRRGTPRRLKGNTERYAWRARKRCGNLQQASDAWRPKSGESGCGSWNVSGEIAAYKETNRAGTGAIRTYALVSPYAPKGADRSSNEKKSRQNLLRRGLQPGPVG